MDTTIVCRAGDGAGGGAGGVARAEICECPGATQEACRNGPVKGEGRSCECIIQYSNRDILLQNQVPHMATEYHPLPESVFYHDNGVCTIASLMNYNHKLMYSIM